MGNPHSPISDPRASIPDSHPSPCYACLYRPPTLADHDRTHSPQSPRSSFDRASSAISRLRSALFPTSEDWKRLRREGGCVECREPARGDRAGVLAALRAAPRRSGVDRRQRARAAARHAAHHRRRDPARGVGARDAGARRGRGDADGGARARARAAGPHRGRSRRRSSGARVGADRDSRKG